MPYLDEEGLEVLVEEVQSLSDERLLEVLTMLYGDNTQGIVPIRDSSYGMFHLSLMTGEHYLSGTMSRGVLLFNGKLFISKQGFAIDVHCEETVNCRYFLLAKYTVADGWSLEIRRGAEAASPAGIQNPTYDPESECVLYSWTHTSTAGFGDTVKKVETFELNLSQVVADLETSMNTSLATKIDKSFYRDLFTLLCGEDKPIILPGDSNFEIRTETSPLGTSQLRVTIRVEPGTIYYNGEIIDGLSVASTYYYVSTSSVSTFYFGLRKNSNQWTLTGLSSDTRTASLCPLWKIVVNTVTSSSGEFTNTRLVEVFPLDGLPNKLNKSAMSTLLASMFGDGTIGVVPVGNQFAATIQSQTGDSSTEFTITIEPGVLLINNELAVVDEGLTYTVSVGGSAVASYTSVCLAKGEDGKWRLTNAITPPAQPTDTACKLYTVVCRKAGVSEAILQVPKYISGITTLTPPSANTGNSTSIRVESYGLCRALTIYDLELPEIRTSNPILLCTLPEGMRPYTDYNFVGRAYGKNDSTNHLIYIWIRSADGEVRANAISGTISNIRIDQSVTFIGSR